MLVVDEEYDLAHPTVPGPRCGRRERIRFPKMSTRQKEKNSNHSIPTGWESSVVNELFC